MSDSSTKSGGIGLCTAMFLIFLTLRLTDHIDWAWYWVAAPLWMPIGLMLMLLLAEHVQRGRRLTRAAKAAREQMGMKR